MNNSFAATATLPACVPACLASCLLPIRLIFCLRAFASFFLGRQMRARKSLSPPVTVASIGDQAHDQPSPPRRAGGWRAARRTCGWPDGCSWADSRWGCFLLSAALRQSRVLTSGSFFFFFGWRDTASKGVFMCLAVVGSFPRGALPLRSCCCCKLHAAREPDGQSDPEKKKI